MDSQSERLKIFKKVEAGEFTLDEADLLLRDLDAARGNRMGNAWTRTNLVN